MIRCGVQKGGMEGSFKMKNESSSHYMIGKGGGLFNGSEKMLVMRNNESEEKQIEIIIF